MKPIRLLVWLFVLLAFTLTAQADVPKLINYQGKLTTAEGGCVDTTVQMTFSIYPDSISIDPLWTETQSSVQVKEGIFSVLLGSVDSIPDSVFIGDIRYLGVKVEDDAEMTPRKAIVSVGYAYRTANADTAGFASNADFADSATNADMVDGKHASDFLRFICQDSEWVKVGTGGDWITVKTCTVPSHTVGSYILVHYDIGGMAHDNMSYQARITINDQEVDSITATTDSDPYAGPVYKSRAVKIDVDNTIPITVAVALKSYYYACNHTFLILGN